MRITRRRLRRVVKEEKRRLMEQHQQLTFNSQGADQAQELSEMIGAAYNLFAKYSFNFRGTPDDTIDRIDGMFMDLIEELGTISVELEGNMI